MILWFLLFFPFHGSNFDRFFIFFLQVSLRIRFELRPVTVSDWSSREKPADLSIHAVFSLISTDQARSSSFLKFLTRFSKARSWSSFFCGFCGRNHTISSFFLQINLDPGIYHIFELFNYIFDDMKLFCSFNSKMSSSVSIKVKCFPTTTIRLIKLDVCL